MGSPHKERLPGEHLSIVPEFNPIQPRFRENGVPDAKHEPPDSERLGSKQKGVRRAGEAQAARVRMNGCDYRLPAPPRLREDQINAQLRMT
jgi:hypothetical protein